MDVTIEGLKSFTVDGKAYDFLPLDEWELNDCCLFEEIAGVQYEELLGAGAMSPRNLRAAMYVMGKHHGLELSIEDAGRVKIFDFMQAAAGAAVDDEKAGGSTRPPARAARKSRAKRGASSSRSKS